MLVFLVCYFSLATKPPGIEIQFKYLDKISHFVSYFLLMLWFAQLYHQNKTRIYYAVFFVTLGIVLEVLQGLGGVRMFEYADMLANTTGVMIGYAITKGRLNNLLP